MRTFLAYISFAISTAFSLTYDERSEKQNLNSYSDPRQFSAEDIRKWFGVPNGELLQQSPSMWRAFFNSISQNDEDKTYKVPAQWINNGLDYSGSGSPVQKGVGSIITESSEPKNPEYFQKSPLVGQMPLQWLIQSNIHRPANWLMVSNYNQDSDINSSEQFGKDTSAEKDNGDDPEFENYSLEDLGVNKLSSEIDGTYSPLGKDGLPAKDNGESTQSSNDAFEDADINGLPSGSYGLSGPLGKDDLPTNGNVEDHQPDNDVLEDSKVNKLSSKIDDLSSPLGKNDLPAKDNGGSAQYSNDAFEDADINGLLSQRDSLSSLLQIDDLPAKGNMEDQQCDNVFKDTNVNKIIPESNDLSGPVEEKNLPVGSKLVNIEFKNDCLVESNEDDSKSEGNDLTETNDLTSFKENHKLFNLNPFLAGEGNILLKQKENGLDMNLGKEGLVVGGNLKDIESAIQSQLNANVDLLKSETGYLLDPLSKNVLPTLRNHFSSETKERPKTGLDKKENHHPEDGLSKELVNANIDILGQNIPLKSIKNAMFKHLQETSRKPMEIDQAIQENASKTLSADNMKDIQEKEIKGEKKHRKLIKESHFVADRICKVHGLDNSADNSNTDINQKTSATIYEPQWDTHLINKRQIGILNPPQSEAYATSNLQSSAAFSTIHRYNNGRYGQYGGYIIHKRL